MSVKDLSFRMWLCEGIIMNVFDEEWAKKLISNIVNIYAANIITVILYGSVARGDESDDSDIDIALIVHKNDKKQHDR